MLSESGDVIKIDRTGRQNTRRYVASLLIGFLMWMGENDTKTISLDENPFENEQNSSVFV